jgi:Fuc2NAc and GlcNAc transferase
MTVEIALTAALVLLLSVFGTGVAREIALKRGVVDIPNQRSSHAVPTPRGGGAAIVLAASAGFIALGWIGVLPLRLLAALAGGGLLVAAVGFADDFGHGSVSMRLAVHSIAAVWAVSLLGGLPPIHWGSEAYSLGFAGDVMGVVAIVWVLNLFNFMDGIDGLAAMEAVFVAWGGAWLAILGGLAGDIAGASIVIGAASAGFAVWNWPPAKVFMGDVGSGYLGYLIAVLALAASHESPAALLVWLILGAAFFVDATFTLLSRVLRGRAVHKPHRSHAYQWLARRWGTHRRVTLVFLGLNFAWLLPLAVIATLIPKIAHGALALAMAPLAILAWLAGAGRDESQ